MKETAAPVVLPARLALTFAFMAGMVVLSVIPGEVQDTDSVFVWAVAETPTPLQKFLHVVFYGSLALLWVWSLEGLEAIALRLMIALLLTAIFGASMEWAQTYIPGRFGTLRDILLNTVGSIVGTGAAAILLRSHRT